MWGIKNVDFEDVFDLICQEFQKDKMYTADYIIHLWHRNHYFTWENSNGQKRFYDELFRWDVFVYLTGRAEQKWLCYLSSVVLLQL